jgi:hypothetical protein
MCLLPKHVSFGTCTGHRSRCESLGPTHGCPPQNLRIDRRAYKEESQDRSRCSLVLLQEQIDVDWDNLLLR